MCGWCFPYVELKCARGGGKNARRARGLVRAQSETTFHRARVASWRVREFSFVAFRLTHFLYSLGVVVVSLYINILFIYTHLYSP